jgi:hypothetical protein
MARNRALAAALLLALIVVVIGGGKALALDDEADKGLAADTLTISVGYFGGPYHEVKTFTVEELWAMDVVYADYTFIDNMPSCVITHVAGVTLSDILDAAGIDINSVQSFNFWTKDKTGDYYTSLTKTYLLDTPRYCYYSLPDNFDYDYGKGNEYATADAVWVPTVLALADDWNRSLAGASFGSDYSDLNTSTRFRLIFGQTNATERTASNSAKWVYAIEVTLGGAPVDTADELPDDKVGSVFTSEDTGTPTAQPSDGDGQGGAVTAPPAVTSNPNSEQTAPDTSEPVSTIEIPDSTELAEPVTPPDNTQVTEVNPDNPTNTSLNGYEIRPAARSERDDGGVQQWRTDEMAQDALALPDVYPDAPVIPAAILAVIVLFLGGALQYYINRKQTGGNI